jgi:hypothetical protein
MTATCSWCESLLTGSTSKRSLLMSWWPISHPPAATCFSCRTRTPTTWCRWWSGLNAETIAELDSADLELNDSFDFYGCFLNNDAVMIKTYEAGLLVARTALTDVSRVRLPGLEVNENGGVVLDTVIGLGDDTVGVDLWSDEREHATIWRIPTR